MAIATLRKFHGLFFVYVLIVFLSHACGHGFSEAVFKLSKSSHFVGYLVIISLRFSLQQSRGSHMSMCGK